MAKGGLGTFCAIAGAVGDGSQVSPERRRRSTGWTDQPRTLRARLIARRIASCIARPRASRSECYTRWSTRTRIARPLGRAVSWSAEPAALQRQQQRRNARRLPAASSSPRSARGAPPVMWCPLTKRIGHERIRSSRSTPATIRSAGATALCCPSSATQGSCSKSPRRSDLRPPSDNLASRPRCLLMCVGPTSNQGNDGVSVGLRRPDAG